MGPRKQLGPGVQNKLRGGKRERREHVLAASEFSVAEIRTCTYGGGQGRAGGKNTQP